MMTSFILLEGSGTIRHPGSAILDYSMQSLFHKTRIKLRKIVVEKLTCV